MTDEIMPPPDSAITPEEWRQTPASVRAWIGELIAEVRELPKYGGAPWEGELAEPSLSSLSAELCNDLSHPEDFSRTRGFCGYSG